MCFSFIPELEFVFCKSELLLDKFVFCEIGAIF